VHFRVAASVAAVLFSLGHGAGAEETPTDATPTDTASEPAPLNPLLGECLRDATADAAEQACTRAIESRQLQGEALATALFRRGMSQARRGQLPAAINDFTAALTQAPDATDALFARASAQAALGHHEEALADYTAILKIDSKDTDTLYRRAWSLTMLGQDKEAIADLTAVLATNQDDIDVLMDRGGLYLRSGDFKAAQADFSHILKLDPAAAAALYNRGRALALQNNAGAAAKDFIAAQQAREENPYAALRAYLATAAAGKEEKKLLGDAIARFPADQWPLPVLATLAGEMSEQDLLAATDLADRTVKQRLAAEAHFYLGEAALAKQDKQAATAHFAAAKGERTVPEVIDAAWRLKQLGG
jgi:lipoprotein NlpI